MTRGNNRETILKVAFTLLIFFFLGEGAIGPCMTPPENTAVFEGELNTLIRYPGSPNGVKWTDSPTTDELTEVTLVNNDDTVDPSYATDYAFNYSAGLTIRNATTTAKPPGHPLSTAGLYTAECAGNRFSVKVLVVRRGPTCSRGNVSGSGVRVTCNAIKFYADSTYNPIAAIFTLYADGHTTLSKPPQRTSHDAYTWISIATFPNNISNSSTYKCGLTFGQPTEVQDPSVVMNAPTFNHTFSC